MSFARHPDFRLQRLTIGAEAAPLLVIDNLVANADELVNIAATKPYGDVDNYYPGVRSRVPLLLQRFLLDELRAELGQTFGLHAPSLRFTSCHFSLVTTPADKLSYLQRIPHIDSFESNQLAFVHYLFKADLGGTAFYRHRKTGFEVIDEMRSAEYLRCLTEEQSGPHSPPPGYINGDTPLYEEVGRQQGVFNRMLAYRRSSLHSGCIAAGFVPDPNPRSGRLSINGFLT